MGPEIMEKVLMKLPEPIIEIITALKDQGCEVYLVGGCVRDILMDRSPHDYDLVTSAPVKQIVSMFPHTAELGARYGTVAVISRDWVVEVSTYKSQYHSSLPGLSGIEADLFWRDFTINAMAMDETGRVVDPFGGLRDLEGKIISAPANQAPQRFRDDPLRMLRAIRFSSTLGFSLHPVVMDAITTLAPLLSRTAVERIRGEIDQILVSERPAHGMSLLTQTGLLPYSVPELIPLLDFKPVSPRRQGTAWQHTMSVLDIAPARLNVRLAALLHDIGKPSTYSIDSKGREHYYGHHLAGSLISEQILHRLKYDHKTIQNVSMLVAEHMSRFPKVRNGTLKQLVRRVGKENLDDLMELQRADIEGSAPPFDMSFLESMQDELQKILVTQPPLYITDLAVDGSDLIALGFQPGPDIGRVLNFLLDIVLDQPEKNQPGILLAIARTQL